MVIGDNADHIILDLIVAGKTPLGYWKGGRADLPYTGMMEFWGSCGLELACWKDARVLNWGNEDAMECGCRTESTS